ncbi:MAG: DUF1289 domain-containing protein [Melioribacteraceae bacterium]|nr:DUF1289 domain-containing protein [Melioribacteraceae bacterium]MCF8354220.1 DUF1289 domain-containing protein [Melioribacteraceae bacterium]MCF8392866.1 DUF1289 domain-containing protein [Melioribacteraceae bacterium]MCF8418648.1 DUF1289 domain-containing protein [Melioribacteraceae bacterium]
MKRKEVSSPCNDVCKIDEQTKVCNGCYRTVDEIAAWSDFSETDKRIVLDIIEKRKEILNSIDSDILPVLEWVI